MEMIFQCANELIRYVIDRKSKKLLVASSKTNYQLTALPWKSLFDPGKEKMQEEATEKMNDEDFKKCIIRDMKTLGYRLKNDKS